MTEETAEEGFEEVTRREKIEALLAAARFRPKLLLLLFAMGILVAVLEGAGLTFIVPIIEIVQADAPAEEADGLMAIFVTAYQVLGIPFTLGFVIAGVGAVMTLRYTTEFFYSWFRRILRYTYQRDLQKRAFDSALDARLAYFDKEGSDEILNHIITEAAAASRVVNKIVKLFQKSMITFAYLALALYLAPLLTIGSLLVLGLLTFVFRRIVNPGYELGDLVADANERRHQSAQAGMMGIRDIRAFNLRDETYERFVQAVDQFTTNQIKLSRNQSAIKKFYNLAVVVFVFVLIYVALRFTSLSFGELGLFLFVMFQLGPKVSGLNELVYKIENELPHLVRTEQFLAELAEIEEPEGGDQRVPSEVQEVKFDDVHFSYDEDEKVLKGVDFDIEKGEFIAFVGQSGAGKSTIVSLLTRFYEPDRGRIYANGRPIDEMDPREWREHIALVRQTPYIFNDTLRYNLTVGNRDATQREIERASRIARVDEFLNELPNGFDSQLGDEGVRLSGGQKQRVSLARALLKDADLLVLDEATSDLDSNLEQQVQAAIETMDRDYAMIAIAHRLSTVQNADRIYTIKDGRIAEKGQHQELLDNGGKYAELYALQSG